MVYKFSAELEIVGINPFVQIPEEILKQLFLVAGKDKSPIPVKGTVNGKTYQQNLMKFKGLWRLYINLMMLDKSPKRIGEVIEVEIEYDPSDRTIAVHPKWTQALEENPEAKKVFDGMTKSQQKEIVRYLSFLKNEESVERNVAKWIDKLTGED